MIHEIQKSDQQDENPIGQYLGLTDEEGEDVVMEAPKKGFSIKKKSEGNSMRGSLSPRRDPSHVVSIAVSVKSNVKNQKKDLKAILG